MGNLYSGFNSKRNFKLIENNLQHMSSDMIEYDKIIQSIKIKYENLSNNINNNNIKINTINSTYNTFVTNFDNNMLSIHSDIKNLQNLNNYNLFKNNLDTYCTKQDNLSIKISELFNKNKEMDLNIKDLYNKFDNFQKFYKLPSNDIID